MLSNAAEVFVNRKTQVNLLAGDPPPQVLGMGASFLALFLLA